MSTASPLEGPKRHMFHVEQGHPLTAELISWCLCRGSNNTRISTETRAWGWGPRQDGSDYCNKALKMRGEKEMEKQRERDDKGR